VNQLEVILFDWGGTLARVAAQAERFAIGAAQASRILCASASPAAVQRLGLAILEAETRAAADPRHREADLNVVLAEWAAGLNSSVSPEQLAAARDVLGLQWVGSLEVFPGVLDAVAELKRRGYRIGLVSNCTVPREYCLKELDRQGLAELLDFTIFSSAVGYRKPSPVIYQAAVKEAFPNGRPPDLSHALFVGDSPALDVIAPAEMGMMTALVGGPPSLWPEDDYVRARPDLRIDSVTELPALLDR
jgi:HAD superfamily hydrolase (TIGR01549 family)